MDWSKIDGALAGELTDDPSGRFDVFIHLSDGDVPGSLGVDTTGQGAIRTARVSRSQIETLSDAGSVRLMRLATALRPADGA